MRSPRSHMAHSSESIHRFQISLSPLASPAAGQSRDGGANSWHWSAAVAGPYQAGAQ